MKNMKKLIFIVIASLSLLVSTVYATWIIMKNVSLTPSYDPNAVNVFMEEFDGQSVDYNGGMQTPKSSKFTTGDVIFKHRKAYSDDSYASGGPFDAGTYEVLIQSNNDSINYSDTVVLFTVNPINPTITTPPTASKPTIEGEQPTISSAVVKGVTADGTLSGSWQFDLSTLTFGKQTVQTLTKTVSCSFIPQSPNYNSISTDISVEIIPVAFIGTNYYGTVEQAIDDAASGNNIFVIPEIKDKTDHYPTIKKAETTLDAGVTLTLTQNSDDYDDGYFIYTNKQAYAAPTTTTTYGSQLCLSENSILNIYGTLTIGAYVQPNSEVYGKRFGVLMNNGTINLKSSSTLNAYGYLKGTGLVEAESQSTINDLFRMYDFAGGRYAPGIYYKTMKYSWFRWSFTYNNVMPFNCYSFHNISCLLNIYVGSTYTARYQINISNTIYVGVLNVIGPGGLFEIETEHISRNIKLLTPSGEDEFVDFDNLNYTTSNQSKDQIEVYDFYGKVKDNTLSLSMSLDLKITSVNMTINTKPEVAMPISTMQFNFKKGSSGVFDASSYKFLPGSKITIEEGASVEFASGINLIMYGEYYDNFITTNSSGTEVKTPASFSYYSQRKNLYQSNSTSVIEKYKSKVIVYGTFIHKGGFGGNIYKSNNAVVTLSNNSGTIKWLDRINYLNIDLSSITQLASGIDLGGTVSDKTTVATINTL